MVEVEELVASGGTGLWCAQLQLLKRLGDFVEADGVKRLDGGGSHHQLSLHRDGEVQVPEMHMRTRDLAEVMTSHLRPGVDVETRKRPLPSALTVGVSSCHQQVNF